MGIVTTIAPIALALIMLSLGASLTVKDFTRVFQSPKVFLVGMVCQLVLLPVIAYLWIERRRNLATIYNKELKNTSLELPIEHPDNRHAYYIYVVKHNERDRIMSELIKKFPSAFISNLINVCVKHIPISQKDVQKLNVIFINKIQVH